MFSGFIAYLDTSVRMAMSINDVPRRFLTLLPTDNGPLSVGKSVSALSTPKGLIHDIRGHLRA